MSKKFYVTICITLMPMVLDALDRLIRKATKKDDLDNLSWINVYLKELINELFKRIAAADVKSQAINSGVKVPEVIPGIDDDQGADIV